MACAFLSWKKEYRFYLESELDQLLVDMAFADVITGFNILGYDIPLLKATFLRCGFRVLNGWDVIEKKCYDPFVEICRALGVTIPKGWKLENIAKSNLSIQKNGEGAMAPELWRTKQIGKLFSYVLRDVEVEHALFLHCRDKKELSNTCIEPHKTIRLAGMHELCEKHGWNAEAFNKVPA